MILIGFKGFISTGHHDSFTNLNDLWEYTPDTAITTGISEHKHTQYSVFPNPSVEYVDVWLSQKGICTVSLKNLLGECIGTYVAVQSIRIPRGGLPPGAYLLTISEGEKSETIRIVFIDE